MIAGAVLFVFRGKEVICVGAEYPVHLSTQRVGTLRMENDGLYRVFHAECTLDTEHIYRLTLCGSDGEMPLGVLAPCGGVLSLTRRISAASLAAAGEVLSARVQTGKLLAAGREDWLLLDGQRPFACTALSEALGKFDGALYRKEGERFYIALPFPEGEPFPLEELFCFAAICVVGGERCAVFTVDDSGAPIFSENCHERLPNHTRMC